MSSANVQQRSVASNVSDVLNQLLDNETLPIKSLAVIKDVTAGVILGEVDEVDHELELAAGVTYIVIGVGKLDAAKYEQGITFVEVKK